MDGKLVNSEPSPHREEKTFGEIFHDCFPYYLSIGMTPEQYWDGDCTLTADYRKASEIANEKRNQELWLMGMYVYEAILDNVPVLRAFGKKNAKPHPYSKEPYAITAAAVKKQKEEKEKEKYRRGLDYMLSKMAQSKEKAKSD